MHNKLNLAPRTNDTGDLFLAPNQLVVLSHHKCGTVWLRSILSDISALNDLKFMTTHHGKHDLFATGQVSIFTNSRYDHLPQDPSFRAQHVIRNPLSIIVSAYHSHLRTHPVEGWPELEVQRQKLRSCSIEAGLALTVSFLEDSAFYAHGTIGPLTSLREWNWNDARLETVRFEDLNQNAGLMVQRMFEKYQLFDLQYLNFDQYSFKQISKGREIGETDDNSHYRSGRPDAWHDELPTEIIRDVRRRYVEILKTFYPEALD
jgi:Sulfotransferase domain